MSDENSIKKLYVHMLGGYSMMYEEEPVSLNCGVISKTMQLLLMLLHAGEKGIPRARLLEILYGREEISNPSNSLRATVFRLKKLLISAGLPEDEYISTSGGVYRWSGKLEVTIDAHEFANVAKLALETKGEEQLPLLKKACDLYRGEFLPMLAGEEWVTVESVHYQELYFSCLREACAQMKERREYEDMLELCTLATSIYPFEEWQILQIDCLMAMNRYKEALKAYEKATVLFFEELGLSPSEKMLARFRAMSGQIHYATGALTDIKNSLKEKEWLPGAYYCTYPSFIDCYRLVARMIERTGQSVFLLLCTLADTAGNPLENNDSLVKYTDKLHNAIGRSLRRGDLYTRYSPNQFLVLLMGISQEACNIASTRIDKNFRDEDIGRKVRINYYATSIADFREEYLEVHFGGSGPKWEDKGKNEP